MKDEEHIIEELLQFSSKLKKVTEKDKKIEILIHLNEFIKEM